MMLRFALAVGVLLSVLAGAGCRTEAPEQVASKGWPERFDDLSFVWTGNKGVDLVSGPTVAVRAYVESFMLGELTGDERYLYPGFVKATDEHLRPGYNRRAEFVWVGTIKNHLLSVERSGADVTATGCMYVYGSATGRDYEYAPNSIPRGTPDAGVTPFRVMLSAPAEPPDTGVQEGPARAPSDDVFAGYRVTGYVGGYFLAPGTEWSDAPSDYQTMIADCIAAAPDSTERRIYITQNYLPRSDFPTLPPSPGWPAGPVG